MAAFASQPRDGADSNARRIRMEIATDLSGVGAVVDSVCRNCLDETASSRIRFRLCTVVAEALANAMLYGNDGDAARRVVVEADVHSDRVVIAVSDEGHGFDHRAVPLLLGDESIEATRGRGLYMIHRLADQVAFNDTGNTIWITLQR